MENPGRPYKYDCGADKQITDLILSECAKRKFHGTLMELPAETDYRQSNQMAELVDI